MDPIYGWITDYFLSAIPRVIEWSEGLVSGRVAESLWQIEIMREFNENMGCNWSAWSLLYKRLAPNDSPPKSSDLCDIIAAGPHQKESAPNELTVMR